jgi:hypothetical protein
MNKVIRVLPERAVLQSGVRTAPVKAAARCIDDEGVVAQLEAAGATLLAMPAKGYSTGMRQMRFDIVHTALEAYGWETAALRAPIPSASAISAMDEAFGWLGLIPEERFVLRRILGARALVHPLTGRHLYPWRRLAALLGSDHKAIQRWHGQGVALIVERLCRPGDGEG